MTSHKPLSINICNGILDNVAQDNKWKKGINLEKINEVYMIVRKEDSEDRNYVIVL